MRVRLFDRLSHLESGTYEACIVEVSIRDTRESRKPQLRATMEVVDPEKLQGQWFYHLIMLDGSSNRYVERFVKAADPRLSYLDFDTKDLLGKCVIVTIRNAPREGGSPNYFPEIINVKSCHKDD